MSEIKLLINSRKHLRCKATQWYNKKDTFVTLSEVEKCTNLVLLKDIDSELKVLNSNIQSMQFRETEDEKALEVDLELCDEYHSRLVECISLLEQKPSRSDSLESARSLLKSPIAPLPKFSSREGEDLTKFLSQFEDTISRFSYPEYDKLLLLKQQISGSASILVNSLEADKQSYTHAKSLLISAFASPTSQKFNVIKKLTEMKLTYSKDPFEYVSQMRMITESVKTLNIDVDTFLQYFYWTGLNDSFRKQLMQITNHTHPTLQEINDQFFDACQRYKIMKGNRTNPIDKSKEINHKDSDEAFTTLAVDVKVRDKSQSKDFMKCCLCEKISGKDAAHPLFKCVSFDTPQAKVDQLNHLNGCVKCGNTNHSTGLCHFRFKRRCNYCSDWHYSFLCTKKSEDSNSKAMLSKHHLGIADKQKTKDKSLNSLKSKQIISNSSVLVTESLQTHSNGNSILPTFSCSLMNGDHIRCFRDSGCQVNFITSKLVESLNLKILDYISLQINGFNSSKHYDTKLVEVDLMFGNTAQTLQAICIPSIDIKLELPGLDKVVNGFVKRGYNLADENLLGCGHVIQNIDFILGSGSAYCFLESMVKFGKDGHSVYSQTPIGIMLLGSVEQNLKDLEDLPFNECKTDARYAIAPTVDISESACLSTGIISNIDSHSIDIDCSVDQENFSVVTKNGKVSELELQKAVGDILNENCFKFTNYDTKTYDESSMELNKNLVRFTLNNTTRQEDGRLVMPLLWNGQFSHLLGTNRSLAEAILKSNLCKYRGNDKLLDLMDQAFKEQEKNGIIERVECLDQYLSDFPDHSYVAHMPVFKLDRQTTKCRMVFLSNLCEKDKSKPMTLSHNQTMFSGPSLNQKLISSLLHLRFDEKLLCFDLKKAFNQIALTPSDESKLLFLWFRNVVKKDFSVTVFKNKRLPFGLRCSPTILLLGLYKLLVLDVESDPQPVRDLKILIYQLFYMDNGAVTMNDSQSLRWAYELLEGIFKPYGFQLQQHMTNDNDLQCDIDRKVEEKTPRNVKLLGMCWDRSHDTLSTNKLVLDECANTKRLILKSIASQFDAYNFNGPILNRSRLFLHNLQCNKELGWDEEISEDLVREWRNIVKQVNAADEIHVKRFVGRRDSSYRLLAFTDSSKTIYGTVVYIQDVSTNEVNFLLAKNRLVNKQLQDKSIPSLEFLAVSLGVEVLEELYQELCGPSCIKPIKIVQLQLFSDSLVSLSWLNAYHNNLEKMQKRSVFVMNRLSQINRLCEQFPITFNFVSGTQNPADCITRSLSYKMLMKSNYLSGPRFLQSSSDSSLNREDTLTVVIPNPLARLDKDSNLVHNFEADINCKRSSSTTHLIPLERFSSLARLTSVYRNVLTFINRVKAKLKIRNPVKYEHLHISENNYEESIRQLILTDQHNHFPEVFEFFSTPIKKTKDIPNIVKQLNIYPDKLGILRVRSKCNRVKDENLCYFPILLAKHSKLTNLIVMDLHQKLSHAGCYSLLAELRKTFWIPHYFSVVKKALKQCIGCRRFNERTIKLNQSPYRELRLDPPNIPFSYVYLDYMGPFLVLSNGKKVKVWILVLSCMWSRAINLKVCIDLSVKEFLRAFQLHTFEYGIPQICISDLGSQIVSGANVIVNFLNDHETHQYFEKNGVKPLKFEQFFKGCSRLGSLVEVSVKLTKRLLHSSMGNLILDSRDFDFLVCQSVHMVNRRPIAFKEALRDNSRNDVPDPISPEMLIHGHALISLNVIPSLHAIPDDPEWQLGDEILKVVKDNFSKLRKARSKLNEMYNQEFLVTLVKQAVDLKDRYKPVTHKTLQKGDIVLIKETHTKPIDYPMAIVREVITNVNNEVTGAILMKGKTRENVKRHSSVLIPLLSVNEMSDKSLEIVNDELKPVVDVDLNLDYNKRIRRKAAITSEKLSKLMLE